jgi:hypothetical protein
MLINSFIPEPDEALHHEILVRAPANVVFSTARNLDLWSIPPVTWIFWLRAQVFHPGRSAPPPPGRGLVAQMLGLGWGLLAERPGRELVMGAFTAPWTPDAPFRAVPPGTFREESPPGQAKIAWSLEAEPLDDTRTLFRSQTLVLGTDPSAKRRLRCYWLVFGAGIVLIRWLALRALKRRAELEFRPPPAGTP